MWFFSTSSSSPTNQLGLVGLFFSISIPGVDYDDPRCVKGSKTLYTQL